MTNTTNTPRRRMIGKAWNVYGADAHGRPDLSDLCFTADDRELAQRKARQLNDSTWGGKTFVAVDNT